MNVKTSHLVTAAAVAVAAAVVVTAGVLFWGWFRAAQDLAAELPDPPTSAEAVASAFRHAYEAGDTPMMCALSTGEALSRMEDPGWCEQPQGWSTTTTRQEQCDIPDGRRVYVYDVDPLVLGQRGMEIALADSGQGVWRVVLFGHTADRDLCDIYR